MSVLVCVIDKLAEVALLLVSDEIIKKIVIGSYEHMKEVVHWCATARNESSTGVKEPLVHLSQAKDRRRGLMVRGQGCERREGRTVWWHWAIQPAERPLGMEGSDYTGSSTITSTVWDLPLSPSPDRVLYHHDDCRGYSTTTTTVQDPPTPLL